MSLLVKRNGSLMRSLPDFEDFFNHDMFNWGLNSSTATSTNIPAVNIKETQNSFLVEMAAPGMKKEEFNISLDGNTLTISSEKKQEESKNEEKYSRKEFSYQSFYRSFNLPKDVVDSEKIMAKYEDGVLLLEIPKKEEAIPKPARTIQIS